MLWSMPACICRRDGPRIPSVAGRRVWPETVSYQSKADLALDILRQACKAGHLTGRWVTADEDYGKVPTFRDALDAEEWWYVLEVPCVTPVFARLVKTEVPAWSGNGRKPSRPRLVDGEAGELLEERVKGMGWGQILKKHGKGLGKPPWAGPNHNERT
jgi:SRSO17 transposase